MTRMAVIAHGGAGADPKKQPTFNQQSMSGGPNSLKGPLLWRWQ